MTSVSPAPGASSRRNTARQRRRIAHPRDAREMMLAVPTPLDYRVSILRTEAYSRASASRLRAGCLDQGRDVLGQPGAAPVRIEGTHLCVQRERAVSRAIRIVCAKRQVDERRGGHRIYPRPARMMRGKSPFSYLRVAARPPGESASIPAERPPADRPRHPTRDIQSIHAWEAERIARLQPPQIDVGFDLAKVCQSAGRTLFSVVMSVPTLIAVIARQQHAAVLDSSRSVQVIDLPPQHLRVP